MPEIESYCPKCYTTWDAHYNPETGVTRLACPRCDERALLDLNAFLHLPAAQRATVQKLLARTAEQEGQPEPSLCQTVVTQRDYSMPPVPLPIFKINPTLTTEQVQEMIRQTMERLAREPMRLVTPDVPTFVLKPLPHQALCIPMEPKAAYDLDKIERIQKMTELLRQCRVKKIKP